MPSGTHRYAIPPYMYRWLTFWKLRVYQVTWETVLPQLQTDPRFVNSPLPPNQQLHLFHAHVNALRAKHLETLQALFASHAPALNTPFTALPVATLLSSPPALKLGFDVDQLEREFDKWQRERWTASRAAFDQMLGENTFVEFWGRLGKMGDKGVNFSITNEDLGDDDDEAQVDMKALAKGVDLKEMIKVLKVSSLLHRLLTPSSPVGMAHNASHLERQALPRLRSHP